MVELRSEDGAKWSEVALANIEREFPVMEPIHWTGPDSTPARPRERHPAFFGSFDWHSCVEMHWLLVRLLRLVPNDIDADRVRHSLDRHLAAGLLRTEVDNLSRSEYPYGYAWALMLAREAKLLHDDGGRRWESALEPLTRRIAEEMARVTKTRAFPIRSGLHPNSAFSLSLSLRYARGSSPELSELIEAAALRYFAGDLDAPASYEPSGTDFLSPCLCEAELMAEVLAPGPYEEWLSRFLPGLADRQPTSLFTPVPVPDGSDGLLAHLHGLNLSRAWCLRRIARSLPAGDTRTAVLEEAAHSHEEASIAKCAGSDYMVEHWLAVYAVLLGSVDEETS